MTENEDTLARVVETLKEPVRIDASFDRRVMAEIERLPQLGPAITDTRSRVAWRARRWTIRLSPLGGLAAAATIAGVMLVASLRTEPRELSAPPVASAQPVAGALTQFVLVAPEAASVAVVGDFNDWNFSATPLTRQAGDGVWWATVPLRPGRYRYAFVVNGENWRSDPNEPAAEDEFGRPNSVVTIGGV
ncbi:MAG: isoamylase early set domain-containing protein [Longimicrobiales bacterium]